MRTCLRVAVVVLAVLAAAVSARAYPVEGDGGIADYVPRAAQASAGSADDTLQIYGVQAAFHQTASAKDLTLMMSLWADDATFVIGGQTYRGKSQIRTWFANVSGSFRPQNSWVSLTPSPKIRISVQGNRATLYFECHYVDVKTGEVKSQIAADTMLVRSNGRWLITNLQAGPANLAQ